MVDRLIIGTATYPSGYEQDLYNSVYDGDDDACYPIARENFVCKDDANSRLCYAECLEGWTECEGPLSVNGDQCVENVWDYADRVVGKLLPLLNNLTDPSGSFSDSW